MEEQLCVLLVWMRSGLNLGEEKIQVVHEQSLKILSYRLSCFYRSIPAHQSRHRRRHCRSRLRRHYRHRSPAALHHRRLHPDLRHRCPSHEGYEAGGNPVNFDL